MKNLIINCHGSQKEHPDFFKIESSNVTVKFLTKPGQVLTTDKFKKFIHQLLNDNSITTYINSTSLLLPKFFKITSDEHNN